MRPASRSPSAPLGTGRDLRARILRHHAPLAVASAAVLIAFMSVPLFDANAHPPPDIFSGAFPQPRGAEMDHGGDEAGSTDHGGAHARPMEHGGRRAGPMDRGDQQVGPMDHGPGQVGPMDHGPGEEQRRSAMRRLTVATGYVALGLLALTLLIGPANLLLRRRNPVSNYLRRDVGTWTAIASVVHVILGLQVHGGGRISAFLSYFVTPDGGPLLNGFGLGNWTGLGALLITLGLLAISSDAALRRLKAARWKWLQRLNYGLFALVIAHAFFYGALLRMTSPYTLLLVLSVIAVVVGQMVGVWLWRSYRANGSGRSWNWVT
jgi:sulfoxide reductase heme-binding subunit YedZ